MEAKDLINYKALSRLLTKNDNSIRRKTVPDKYKEQVKEIETIIDYCIHKWQKQ